MSAESPDEETIERAIAAIHAAVATFQEGKAPTEVCAFCGGRLDVVGLPPSGPPFSAWQVGCPCGKSNTTLKGL